MRLYKKKLKKSLSDIRCDICKVSCKSSIGDYEHATISAQWGYCSRKDGEEYHIDICENCFDKVIQFVESLK